MVTHRSASLRSASLAALHSIYRSPVHGRSGCAGTAGVANSAYAASGIPIALVTLVALGLYNIVVVGSCS